jgi:hypothetical protein
MKKAFLILSILSAAACNQPAEQITENIDTTAAVAVDTTDTITPDTVAVDTVQ